MSLAERAFVSPSLSCRTVRSALRARRQPAARTVFCAPPPTTMPMCRAGNVRLRLSSLPPLPEQPDPARELLPAGSARTAPGRVRRLLQPAALPRESQQSDSGRCLLRACSNHPDTEGKHQAENHRATTPAASCTCSHNFNSDGPDPLLNLLLTCLKGSGDIQFTVRSRFLQQMRDQKPYYDY